MWYNDESCYESCELPLDELAETNQIEYAKQILEKKGLDGFEFGDIADLIAEALNLDKAGKDGDFDKEVASCRKYYEKFWNELSQI